MQISDLMNRSMRIAKFVLLAAGIAALQACGGGGTSPNTGNSVGPLTLAPSTGDLYAGVPFNFLIGGGVAPYQVTTDQQQLIPGPFMVNGNTFTVVPNNPGVVDVGQDPNQVPSRLINITVRDNLGTQTTASFNVTQNFLTGYSFGVNSISRCGVTGADAVVAGCAGFETRVDIRPTSAGLLRARRTLRLSVTYGPFAFYQADNVTLGNSITVTTDDQGNGTARFFVTANSLTQLAAFRLTDVSTGAYVDHTFLILSAPAGPLTIIPTALPNLIGPNSATCGQGQGSIIVLGGSPPYRAISSNPTGILVQPETQNASGSLFTVFYGGGVPPNCTTGQVVITDSAGGSVTVTATTSPGTTAPVTPLTVSPSNICAVLNPPVGGNTFTVLVSGGANNKVLNTTDATRATVTPLTGTGNFAATITTPVVVAPGTAVIQISDGTSTTGVTVNRQVACP